MMRALRWWILRRLLRAEHVMVLETLERPDRYIADLPISRADQKQWEAMITSPLGRRIDHLMINWIMGQQQRVLHQPHDQLERAVGVANGIRAGWEMAKAISRMDLAEEAQTETDASTADDDPLAHARP